MARTNILSLLEGGDRRMIGRADEVAAMVSKQPQLFPELMAGLWSSDPLVCMRAADAVEKITRERRELLQPYRKKLLQLMNEASQQELRWHLALMVPRLRLNAGELRTAVFALSAYLEDRSSIVKTCALQGLAELAEGAEEIRPAVVKVLRRAAQSGTPAMKARSLKLLHRLRTERTYERCDSETV
ncbi:MAG: hypothetical protein ABR874_15710 [Candidatus Sulfotelmatobacter sp.]|jgi:hypothetical protein